LTPDWDSHGAAPISSTAIQTLEYLLMDLRRQKVPTPSVVPRGNGGVTVEWHRPGFEFSIDVDPDGDFSSAYLFALNKVDVEFDPSDSSLLNLGFDHLMMNLGSD
jgi:hypothetical protein